MIPFAVTADITVDVSASLVAIVTLTTVLVIGLATLPRPSAATITWGAAFSLGMLGTYLWVAAQQVGAPVLQAVSSAFMVCFEALLWLGLRFHAGRRTIWWPVAAFLVLAPVSLGIGATTAYFAEIFRVVFLAGGAFAGLVAFELFRMRRSSRDVILPLALASCAFVAVSAVGFIAGFLGTRTLSSAEQLVVLRDINGVGTLVTCVCAAITLVLLVRADIVPEHDGEGAAERARRRLLKAKAQRDPAWSVLDIRLDDPSDLREAWTAATFARIADGFHDRIVDALPASADAERVAAGHTVVVIHGSDEAVQHHLRTVLSRVSAIDEDGPLASMRVSASVGWASAAAGGYDYDVLAKMAAEGAVIARADGGDRWQRVRRGSLSEAPPPTTLEG
ncbi:hypothetical protein [Microbacterium tumbae]